ncbi:sensor histidine kinase [Hyalangium rubrum]|uniref:Histidine kinase n=1 Tax=Hyalangium rubrum TaxID=3103134 RepID=A0ABU5HAB9_9BACT|nr:histidine kinase [Hyalangium sp. s54d21]MDY7230034.1 histidine kinase [Hyalangium sp. s54d21]
MLSPQRTSKAEFSPWDWRLLALAFLGWGAVFLVSFGQQSASALLYGTPAPDRVWWVNAMGGGLLWVLMTPCIFAASERFPLGQRRWALHLGVHVALLVLFWVMDVAVWLLLDRWMGAPPKPWVDSLLKGFFVNFFSYFAVASLSHALRYHRLYVERRLRTAELESQLLRAQFFALQMQLRPHFLFNALNTISGLIRTGDSRGAVQMTAGLADLLRAVLRSDGAQEVPLRQELDFVGRYLRVEQLRFQDRLRTHIEVDPEASDALVPHLLLQPLVENAVRHGSRGDEGENRVDIHITREADMLWLRVRDMGHGPIEREKPEPGVPEEGGIGLTNTRARLRHLYGDAHRLELLPAEGGGALAEVAIPFRRVGAEQRS